MRAAASDARHCVRRRGACCWRHVQAPWERMRRRRRVLMPGRLKLLLSGCGGRRHCQHVIRCATLCSRLHLLVTPRRRPAAKHVSSEPCGGSWPREDGVRPALDQAGFLIREMGSLSAIVAAAVCGTHHCRGSAAYRRPGSNVILSTKAGALRHGGSLLHCLCLRLRVRRIVHHREGRGCVGGTHALARYARRLALTLHHSSIAFHTLCAGPQHHAPRKRTSKEAL
mmetsp:Transcript_9981/g.29938  ORF Transcript_9981/g.29938 Transcript_9981/m.29938 type:complete len:226 (-) Transcript_9981:144-821(-)